VQRSADALSKFIAMERPLDAQLSREELQQQREQIRRSFLRANTAVAIILVAVLGLAMAAVFEALRAGRHSRRAEAAEQDGREKLWRSYLTQARAGRLSGLMGRRSEGLETIRAAASIRPALELRNEALACFALTDLEEDGPRRPYPAGTRVFAFDGSRERFALAATNGTVSVRSFANNTEIFSARGVDAGMRVRRVVHAAQLSRDGRYVAARFFGGTLLVWDLTNAQPVFTNSLNILKNVFSRPEFVDGGRLIAFADAERGRLSLFDLAAGHEVELGRRIDAHAPFAFQPGQKVVAIGEGRDIILWDWKKGQALRTFRNDAIVLGLAWDAEGRRLACAGRFADVTLWDTKTGDSRLLSGHGTSVGNLTFSHDGTMLLTSSFDGLTRLWDTERGRLLCSTERGYGLAFSSDDGRIFFEEPARTVGAWRVNHSPIYRTLLAPEMRDQNVLNQDLSADGRWLVWGRLGELWLWDLTSSKPPLVEAIDGLQSVGFHPQKPGLFICRAQSMEMRPIEETGPDATVAARLGEAQRVRLPPRVLPREFALSADGRTIVIQVLRRRIFVVDLEQPGKFVFLDPQFSNLGVQGPGSQTGAGRMALSPDGRWLATGFGQLRVPSPQVWDARTGKLVQALPTGFSTVAFSSDGKWLLTGSATEYALWSVGDWRAMWRVPREGSSLVPGAAAFTREGALIAVASSRHRVQLLDRATGSELASLISPDPLSVNGLRLKGDGSFLAVATPQGLFQFWDLQAARHELATLNLDWAPLSVARNPALTTSAPQFWPGTLGVIGIGLAVVVAIVVVVLFVLRRHRQLIEDFARTETLAVRRDRQLEMARVELMHSQKMKALGTLAAGIAHDFNNLLSVVRMSNKLIAREVPGNAEVSENVAAIEQAVQQGKHVVRSMLGYSREAPDDGSPQDGIEVVEETVALLSKEFLSGIQLTLEFDRQTPRVSVSRGRLEQILLNLLVNAAEAMAGQGKLTISVGAVTAASNGTCVLRPKPAERYIQLTVADSGGGIPPEILPRIFEPFFTTKVSGTNRGTGLGLSMVYTIAEQEGLGLGVETSGKGTAFRVVIPVSS
jgi:signal transduction histidine kinase